MDRNTTLHGADGSDNRQSVRRVAKLALYSDQIHCQNTELDRRLMSLIGMQQPRIAFVAADSRLAPSDFEATQAYYARIGASLVLFINPADDVNPTQRAALLACDAIHLSGGDTYTFLSQLRRTGLFADLLAYVASGKVLIGVSAGAIMMTPDADTGMLCGDLPDTLGNDHTTLKLIDCHFWPHFDPTRRLSSGQRRLLQRLGSIYACPDGSGIVVDGEHVELFGAIEKVNFPDAVLALTSSD